MDLEGRTLRLTRRCGSTVRAFYLNGTFLAGDSHFNPLPEISLNRTDGDIAVFFLSANAVQFAQLTPDPWYNGTDGFTVTTTFQDHNGTVIDVQNTTLYYSADAATPLGCRVQEQFCNPNRADPTDPSLPLCAPLSGLRDSARLAMENSLWGPMDRAEAMSAALRVDWFEALLLERRAVTPYIDVLGSHSLLARYSLGTDGIQGGIPDNQWMLDAAHWLGIQLADMQAAAVAMATGPTTDTDLGLPYQRPNVTEQFDMCGNMVRLILSAPSIDSPCRRTRDEHEQCCGKS